MIQILIKKQNVTTNQANFNSIKEGQEWLQLQYDTKAFGEEARTEQRLVTEAIPAVLDEDGVEISPEVPAVYETVEIPAEYTVEIKDITAELEQSKINAEALAYLAATDWYILRELDEGTPCPQEVKQARAEARAKIVK